jgi:hypothetical protein
MKTHSCFLAATAAIAILGFAGCTNNQESTASANTNPSATSYSRDDLQKTGKRTSGEALQAADPSVTASGRQ